MSDFKIHHTVGVCLYDTKIFLHYITLYNINFKVRLVQNVSLDVEPDYRISKPTHSYIATDYNVCSVVLSPVSLVVSQVFTPCDISDIKWHHVLHIDRWRPSPCLTQFWIKNDPVYKLTFCCWMNFTLFLIFLNVYGADDNFLRVDVKVWMPTSGVWLMKADTKVWSGKLGWEIVELER